jgi:hypothetical protein
MDHSPAFSRSRPSLVLCVGGMLFFLGAIWLGLLAIEYGSTRLAHGGEADFWTEQTLISAISSLVSMVIGAAIVYFSSRLQRHHHSHHRRHAHRTGSTHVAGHDAHSHPSTSAPDDDESVSFDMDKSARESQLPPDTPGAPARRPKIKVRVRQRIRKETDR